MSLEDLFSSDSFLPAVIVIAFIVLVVAVPIGIAKGKQTNDQIYGNKTVAPVTKQENARIIATQDRPHPLNASVMIHLVVFQFTDGRRIELAIENPAIYGVMMKNDVGTLRYQGKKFISFERDKNNEI